MGAMGRATEAKSEQILYLKNRIRLIYQMTNEIDESASESDLENLDQQIKALQVKLQRFKQDWKKEERS